MYPKLVTRMENCTTFLSSEFFTDSVLQAVVESSEVSD